MKKVYLLLLTCIATTQLTAQTYTNGLTATGSGTSTNVRLGGANPLLENTTVDLGTYSFGFKKLTADYFTILNNGNIGIGNAAPVYKFDVSGSGQFTGDLWVNSLTIGKGGGNIVTNLMLGYHAGQLNTTGSENNFIGYNAGSSNTTGSYNYIFGNQAGLNNTSGNYNTFINYQAGKSNTSGSANIFMGYAAGSANTTGSYNSFIGSVAGTANTTGENNVFMGRYAGASNTTGSYNIALGISAGEKNTTGTYNTMIGYSAGRNIAGGNVATLVNSSVFLGAYSTAQADNQGNQIVIGFNATGLGSNTAVIGNSSITKTAIYGNLLLGTTTDDGSKLNVNGNIYTNSKMLIGTTGLNAGSHSLAVNGSAIFTKAVVKLTNVWPDYVFKPDYSLRPLSELEAYIQKNNHLPEMPVSEDINLNGIDLGSNQTLLLKKVEELTLYLIDLNKKVEMLLKENELLKQKNASIVK